MSPRKIREFSNTHQAAQGRSRGTARGRTAARNWLLHGRPLIVGTIHSEACLLRARALSPGAVDLFELRVDHFAANPQRLLDFAHNRSGPLIITVRAREEGGAVRLSPRERIELFMPFLPRATFIDLELRSIVALAPVVKAARAHKAGVILSHHDFRKTPSARRLAAIMRKARAAGADITKIAAHTATLPDLITLLLALAQRRGASLRSIMAMGPWGKAGRLLLACAGSILNYGYLGKAQVPGQWEATTFKLRLAELLEDTPAKKRSAR
jgi:3-dehydroquinate dehydratase-1